MPAPRIATFVLWHVALLSTRGSAVTSHPRREKVKRRGLNCFERSFMVDKEDQEASLLGRNLFIDVEKCRAEQLLEVKHDRGGSYYMAH